MKLFDTTLPQNYSKALFEEQCLDIAEEHADKMFDVMFTGSANLLKAVRSQDKAAVFKVNNLNGSMVAAAICRYFKNEEDETKPGNWSLVWTFYESDIPEDAIVIDLEILSAMHTSLQLLVRNMVFASRMQVAL